MLIGLALVALTTVISGYAILDVRTSVETSYIRETKSLGRALTEQTSRYVQEINLSLQDIEEHVEGLQIQTPEQFSRWIGGGEARAYLASHLVNMAQVSAIIAVDSTTRAIASTAPALDPAIDPSKLDFLRAYGTTDEAGLLISERNSDILADKASIFVARRVRGSDGALLGVVAAAIDVAAMEEFYRSINTRPGMTVTLFRRDGLVLIRQPDPTHDVGRRISSAAPWYNQVAAGGGFYRSPGFLGDARALVSVHPLPDCPLVIDVAITERVALETWRHEAVMLAAAAAAAVAGFVLLAMMIAALFRYQERQHVALRESEATLAAKSLLLQTTLDHMDQGLILIDSDRTVPVCNRRACELLDLPPELMVSRPGWEAVVTHQQQSGEFANADPALQDIVERSLFLNGLLVYDRERPNGQVLEVRTAPLPDGAAVRTYTDITERKRAEERVAYLAHHDALTGLANRTLLQDRLTQAIEYARRSGGQLAVLAVDLDHFKKINDHHGHAIGDRVLRETAERLRGAVRSADTVARSGGDEFIVVQIGAAHPEDAVELAKRLLAEFSKPLIIENETHNVGGSIGIAFYPMDGDDPSALLKNADIALYRAKSDGRGAFRLFEREMDRQFRERNALEGDLREAIRNDLLTVSFQPQFTCASRVITGFEALVRWHHPERGPVSPTVFVPLAEESHLILDLGRWVLRRACEEAAAWPEPYRVAVNFSAAQFRDRDLSAQVRQVLRETGLPPSQLEIEVTESLLIQETDRALRTLGDLKQMGIRIALDDFGTGYSSLSYLRLFPFDKIKIDQSFVRSLTDDPSSLSIIRAILALGKSLHLDVIGEGVETEEQLRVLVRERCDEVQGFLLGKPMPAVEVSEYMRREAWRSRSVAA
jgi:diguanylate cyclase (GGDEF)-like protein